MSPVQIYPAIDLYEGKVVRLAQGDFNAKTVYSGDPVKTAAEWEEQGAQWLHIVDLEGAKTGEMKNLESLQKIRAAVRCGIQFGGGVRKLEDLASLTRLGINRIVLGTKSLEEPFFSRAMAKYAPHIAVGLDIRDDMLQTQGWLKSGEESLQDALARFNKYPLETIIYTDIQKDGMLQGPDFFRLSEILTGTPARVILSGGVGSLLHIQRSRQVKRENFEGLIIGRALYDKKFTLREALEAAKL